ncbi:MFS transporter [Nostoc sp. FACHB-152]|uniref:MFS transporter n=1 Tax=unclassified Nostoc TaxID=2593658 RepID=UPI001687F3F0|nr:MULTISPECIES: MFS transporter [unclassified Nostoc]MBD2448797.1 MFS transporter [Nostoc sp. FACHB-152]MBD2467576.1 MFS transporter [Nostoc sp. FACHB-145]
MNRSRVQVITLTAICLALFMANFDNTAMNLVLANIQVSLDGKLSELQWIINAYTLSAASFLLVGGVVGNFYGRKRVFLGGLAIFAIASVICSMALNLNILIVGRVLQGIGAAAFIANSVLILANNFVKPKHKATAIIIWSAVSILALFAGPDFGQLVADTLGWRSLFWMNLPLSAIAFWLTCRFSKEVANSKKPRLNLSSLVPSLILLAGLIYTLAHNQAWRSPLILWLLTVNGISLIAFLVSDFGSRQPIFSLRLFRNQKFVVLNVFSILLSFTIGGLVPQQVQAQTTEPEQQFPLSLLTPASDLVQGGFSNFEILFARAGNDTIYSDDPLKSNTQTQNIDFLFGDLFDNSPEEFEIVLNIQNTSAGGNPLLILDRDIPSVGQDRFVLGDIDQPYYSSPNPATLGTTNLLGLNEFAVIYDLKPGQDFIQLNGNSEDYRLVDVNGLKVDGIQQLFYGKALFSLQQGLPDLIAYIIAKPEVTLDLKSTNFRYVGTKPAKKPVERKKIGQLGTTGNDLGLAAATDSLGNVLIAGDTTGPLFGTNQGFKDVWVAKYDSNGSQIWGKQFGSSGSDNVYAIATDNNNNFYLAGETGSSWFSPKQSEAADFWVAKYDSNGNLLWGKQFGTSLTGGYLNAAWGLDLDPAGNIYLSGLALKVNQNREIFDFPAEDDAWVIKLDSNGNQQWFTQIDTPFFNECYDLAVDKDGNSYFVGWTQGLVKESDPSRSLLKYDAWVTKVNTAGQIQWIQQLGSKNEGLEFAWAVDTDSQGNVYVTGWTTSDIGTIISKKTQGRDIWLVKLSPDNGTQLWAKQFGSVGDDGMILSDMDIDAQDNIYLIGHTNDKLGKGDKDANYNAWLAKFDTQGNNKWIQQFGSKNNLDYPSGVTADNSGKVYVTGFTDSVLGSITTGVDTSAVDAWLSQFDAEKGSLLKFIGDTKDNLKIAAPDAIATIDASNDLVTAERLPDGDNIIKTTGGISANVSFASYGAITSSLGKIFNPEIPNSFPQVLAQEINSGKIVIPNQ